METRLDRLFLLLDTGSSAITRKAAAQQLGQVQRLHPHELPLLLRKVFPYLKSPSWDTRIAASQAINAIISHVPQWDPARDNVKVEGAPSFDSKSDLGRLGFKTFNVGKVLANRHYLMASEGKEFDEDEPLAGQDPKERLIAQRHTLNQKLGLDLAAKLGIDTGDLVTAEDLEVNRQIKSETDENTDTTNKQINEDISEEMKQLSSREAKRAKRKARQGAKQKSRDMSREGSPLGDQPSSMRARKKEKEEAAVLVDSVPDPAGTWPESAQYWPFESFCDLLISCLFSPSWETRHGSGTALREVIQLHGRGADKMVHQTSDEMRSSHSSWLEDVALRLLCVLALDRFGDFISDQVVAPVRETSAQALGSLATLMEPCLVRSVVQVLLQLLEQPEWEARHGGLLGLKYLMAARQDLSQDLLPLVYPCLFAGLQDGIDDVSAVAAAALVPLADPLVKLLPVEQLSKLLETLWDSLLDLDELTGSTSSILTLLSLLVAHSDAVECVKRSPLADLVPRLWPFLSHSSSQVRRSTLKTVETLLMPADANPWIESLAPDLLRHVFQRSVLEHCQDILDQIEHLWAAINQRLPLQILLPAACPYMANWICLVMQPSRVPFDPAALVFPPPRKESPVADPAGRRRNNQSLAEAASSLAPTSEMKYLIGGTDHVYDNPVQREKGVIRARCLAAAMLGLLSQSIVQPMPGLTYTPDMETPIECFSKLLVVHLSSRSSIQRTVVAMILAEWAERCHHQPTSTAKLAVVRLLPAVAAQRTAPATADSLVAGRRAGAENDGHGHLVVPVLLAALLPLASANAPRTGSPLALRRPTGSFRQRARQSGHLRLPEQSGSTGSRSFVSDPVLSVPS